MNNEPLISIIIPVYNMETQIHDCLNSLSNQTYKNLEILCVNDGSTDDTSKIIERYSMQDSRIFLINQENQGPLIARSTGLKKMHGDYYFFIDADDYLVPYAIEHLFNQMQKDGTDIALSNFRIGNKKNFNYTNSVLTIDNVLFDILNCKSKMFPCWGMLIGKCKIDYNFKGYTLCEDELFALDLFVDTQKISFHTEPLITYRNKPSKSVTKREPDYYYQGYLAAMDFFELISKDRPNLKKYAKTRLLMHSFYCFFNCNRDGFAQDKLQQMICTIKNNRKDVLFNSHAAMSIRLTSLLSYFGMNTTTVIFKIYSRCKR